MPVARIVAASCLFLLAVAHSALGEREVLRPLFSASWDQPGPRWAMQRLLRFAWHLTSIAWIGLGAGALGASGALVVALVGLSSGALVFVMLRGHFAWPLFLLAGLAGLQLEGWLGAPVLGAGVGLGAAVAVGAAGVHVYWAVGGRRGIDVAIPPAGAPDSSGAVEPAFVPPPWLTALVAVALLVFAGLNAWVYLGAPLWARAALGLGLGLMLLRAMGDGRRVGFSKTERGGAFARWDDLLFTPLVVVLALGSGAALLNGAG